MKDQYFGDINDYRKYGLLRSIIGASGLPLMVAWMLTLDDQSTDGKFVSYLENGRKWSAHDPGLFEQLRGLITSGRKRQVSMIEGARLLPNTEYFSEHVPDASSARSQWFESLSQRAKGSEIVFLDPDNGLEVKSKPYGQKNSSKFYIGARLKIFGALKSLC